jgi:hypothetical protein
MLTLDRKLYRSTRSRTRANETAEFTHKSYKMESTKESGNISNTRQYSDYSRKHPRVACGKLGFNQNFVLLREIYDRLEDWNKDHPNDSAHNHIPDTTLAKESMDPKSKHRRKKMTMAYKKTAKESEDEEEEMKGSDDDTEMAKDPDQGQDREGDAGRFDAGSRKSSASKRRRQDFRLHGTADDQSDDLPTLKTTRKIPKSRSMAHMDPKSKGKQK